MVKDSPKPTLEKRLKTAAAYAGAGAALGAAQGVVLPSVLNPSKPESTRYKSGAAIGGLELLLGDAPILGALIGLLGPDGHSYRIDDNTIRGDLKLLLLNKGYDKASPENRAIHRKDIRHSVVFNSVICAGLGAVVGFFFAKADKAERQATPQRADSSWAERINSETPASHTKGV